MNTQHDPKLCHSCSWGETKRHDLIWVIDGMSNCTETPDGLRIYCTATSFATITTVKIDKLVAALGRYGYTVTKNAPERTRAPKRAGGRK